MYRFKHVVMMVLSLSVLCAAQASFTVVQSEFNWLNSKGSEYSPFDKRGYYAKVSLEINIPANSTGDYFLSFTNQSNENYRSMRHEKSADKLIYYLSKKTNTNQYLSSWPNIINDEGTVQFSLSGSNSPILRVPIYIWIDPGQNIEPGNYSESIPIKVYKGQYNSGSMPTEVQTLTIVVRAQVSNEAQVSIGNDSFSSISEFKVSFEPLEEGETISYVAYVKSNQDYTLKLYSENRARLKNENEAVKTIIPYQVYVNDQKLDFYNGNLVEVQIERDKSKAVDEHQIKLILGSASHAFKGAYSDRLSLRATNR